MAKYKCLMSSTTGRRGSIVELTESHNTKELVKRGLIAPLKVEKTKEEPKPKGGKSAQDANPKEKVETK